jgi:hypothetical protein
MQHFTCDLCGCRIDEQRYVVKLEVFPTFDPDKLSDSDLDVDHLQAVAESIEQEEMPGLGTDEVHGTGVLQFDLCDGCQRRLRRDPLGKTSRTPLHFSEN